MNAANSNDMNDIHISGIRLVTNETREEAAMNVKAFLNNALQELSPRIGRIDFVSIPGTNSNGILLFGFANMIDRRFHRDLIALLNLIEYRGQRLVLTLARREPNINSCRAVREGRRMDSTLNRRHSLSPKPQIWRSQSQQPAPTPQTISMGRSRGILPARKPKIVTFKGPSDSDTEELEHQREALHSRLARKNERAARRQEDEEEIALRRRQLDREEEQVQAREVAVVKREEAVARIEAGLRGCAATLAQWNLQTK